MITRMLSCRGWMPLMMVLLCLFAGTGQVWAAKVTFTAKTAVYNGTGGTAKVELFQGTTSKKSAETTKSTLVSASFSDGSNGIFGIGASDPANTKATYTATPNTGYYFVGWFTAAACTGTPTQTANPYTTPETKKADGIGTLYARFDPYDFGEATPSAVVIDNAYAKHTYEGSVVIPTTGATTIDNFNIPVLTPNSGSGTFTIVSQTWAGGKLTINYCFNANGFVGTTTATLTARTEGNVKTKDISLTATTLAPAITSGNAGEQLTPSTPTELVAGTATFNVTNAENVSYFTAPTFSNIQGGGTWTITSTSYAAGVYTVNYTFQSDDEHLGDHSADLTLTATVGSATKTITATAYTEAVSLDDAKVTSSTGTLIYQGDWATAWTKANANVNCTLQLLRNVDVSAKQAVAKTFKLDLNGKTLTFTSDGLTQYIGAISIASSVTLTVTDSKTNGTIKTLIDAGATYQVPAVYLYAASAKLILNGGILYSGTASTTVGTYGVYNRKGAVEMNGGRVEAHATTTAYGIVTTTGTATITGGDVRAIASKTTAAALYTTNASGKFVVSDATLYAEAQAEGFDAATKVYAYGVFLNKSGAQANISRTHITAKTLGFGQYTYGLHAIAGSNFTIDHSTIVSDCHRSYGFGIYSKATEASISDCDITVSNVEASTVYGINVAAGHCIITGTNVRATSPTTTVAALYADAACNIEVDNCDFLAEGQGSTLAAAGDVNAYGVFLNKTGIQADIKNSTIKGYVSNATYGRYPYGISCIAGVTSNIQNCNITAESEYQYAFAISNAGTMTLEGNTVLGQSNGSGYARAISNSGTLTVKSGFYTADSHAADCYGLLTTGPLVTINGGHFYAYARTSGASALYINTATSVINVTGGSFLGESRGETLAKAGSIPAYGLYINTKGGTVTVENASFTGSANNASKYSQNAYGICQKAGTLTIGAGSNVLGQSNYQNAYGLYCEGGSFLINDGKFSATADNKTAYGVYVNTNGSGEVTTGKFNSSSASTFADVYSKGAFVLKGGYYVHETNLASYVPAGYSIGEILSARPEYEEGYRYTVFEGENHEVAVCKIPEADRNFISLEDAIAYVNNNSATATIVMIAKTYTLPAGNYTLPSNATLLVPYKADQISLEGTIPDRVSTYKTPSCYLTLVFAEGVNMNVDGKICIGGSQCVNGMSSDGTGIPSGPYGKLQLNEGSNIILKDGSYLYCWGYATGAGKIDAKPGAEVHEQFQVYDWKGGTNTTFGMINNAKKAFPVNQYFIQNVEVETTYRPGAKLITAFGLTASDNVAAANDVRIIGTSDALFLMNEEEASEDTWVRKKYDATTDRQVYEINSSAHVGSLTIGVSGYEMASANYVLPITNNMKIHLLSGYMDFTQSTVLLPGAEVEVDKESTITINPGNNLYVYDDAEWGPYVYNGAFAQKIRYTPSWSTCPRSIGSAPALGDAKINVHGTFDVQGKLYTTSTGSSIFSSNEDAGTVHLSTDAPSATGTVSQPISLTPKYDPFLGKVPMGCDVEWADATCNSAWLRNEDDSYTKTYDDPAEGNGVSGDSYCYINNKWRKLIQEDCFVRDGEYNYFIKPGAYVQIETENNAPKEYDDHTYHDYAGLGHQFIFYDDCQWWEVMPYDDIFYCEDNNTYYYYDEDFEGWLVKTVNVTWKNWDGTTIKTYENVDYNSIPKYLDSNPTRAKDAYYTYDFTGWLPVPSQVKEDAVYTAQYEKKDCKYTIIFKDGSTTLETDYYKYGEMPVCHNEPSRAGYTLSWSPALGAVTGDATYTAQWNNTPQADYSVTFKNHDGSILQGPDRVATGMRPVYTGAIPTKTSISVDAAFEFDGWTPAITEVSADVVYTAKFKEVTPKYTITFKSENGATTLQTCQVAYGEMPIYTEALPTKEHANPTGYYYELVWSPLVSAVVGNQTYTATFEERVNTMRLIVDANGMGTVSIRETDETSIETDVTRHSAVYDYNKQLEISATANTAEHYHFVRWSDGNTSADWRTITVTGTNTYTAIFELDQFTITDGSDSHVGSIDGAGTYNYGTVVTLTARPKDYCHFVQWSDGNTNISRDVTITENVTYTAEFDAERYEITSGNVTGTVDGTGSYPYGARVILTAIPEDGYEFAQWSDGITTSSREIIVTGNAEYTPEWQLPDNGNYLDIVDWTSTSLTINMNGSTQRVIIGDFIKTYEDRETDLTMVFTDLDLTQGGTITIKANNGFTNALESSRRYKVPYIYTSNTAITSVPGENAEIWVKSGKLTINGTMSVKKVVVCPGAELAIESGKALTITEALVLRTKAFSSAILTNNGTLTLPGEAKMYYTRIVADNTQSYQFALPFASTLANVKYSNGNAAALGTAYGLQTYNAQRRANKGTTAGNWKPCVPGQVTELAANTGYQLLSASPYYCEYYFPVSYSEDTDDAQIAVIAYSGTASEANAGHGGWNYICSPYTAAYEPDYGDSPEDGIKINELYDDNLHYHQHQPGSIYPVAPFYYQTKEDGNLVFGETFTLQIPASVAARQAQKSTLATQWLQLHYANAAGTEDETNIYLNADKFSTDYETGYDVVKLSTTGARPFLYITLACGDLAFAALPDEAGQRIPLTVYSPAEGEYTFSLTDNNYMGRLDAVYLLDEQTGIYTDLLSGNTYSVAVEQGTTAGRFYLMAEFAPVPGVTTGMDNTESVENITVEKVLINGLFYIRRGGELYDWNGRQVK